MIGELPDLYRTAMRRFVGTVSIVTCSDGNVRSGITVTAVTSVSAHPPAVLVCVNRASSFHSVVTKAGRFCINILQESHIELPAIFGGRAQGEARFGFGNWETDEGGSPYLVDAQATLSCSVDTMFEYATHTIFIGLVERVRVTDEISPLLYQNGAYARSTLLPQVQN